MAPAGSPPSRGARSALAPRNGGIRGIFREARRRGSARRTRPGPARGVVGDAVLELCGTEDTRPGSAPRRRAGRGAAVGPKSASCRALEAPRRRRRSPTRWCGGGIETKEASRFRRRWTRSKPRRMPCGTRRRARVPARRGCPGRRRRRRRRRSRARRVSPRASRWSAPHSRRARHARLCRDALVEELAGLVVLAAAELSPTNLAAAAGAAAASSRARSPRRRRAARRARRVRRHRRGSNARDAGGGRAARGARARGGGGVERRGVGRHRTGGHDRRDGVTPSFAGARRATY